MPKEITVEYRELFNEETGEIITVYPTVLKLEHSLVSLSKWESIWEKPFLTKDNKTMEETISYIKCMTMNPNKIDPIVYDCLTQQNLQDILKYIESPQSATTFGQNDGRPSREIITSELVYYWMLAFNIPFECEKWHLNRLLTLIKICGIKNEQPKSMSKGQILNRNKSLNEARRKAMNSKG